MPTPKRLRACPDCGGRLDCEEGRYYEGPSALPGPGNRIHREYQCDDCGGMWAWTAAEGLRRLSPDDMRPLLFEED